MKKIGLITTIIMLAMTGCSFVKKNNVFSKQEDNMSFTFIQLNVVTYLLEPNFMVSFGDTVFSTSTIQYKYNYFFTSNDLLEVESKIDYILPPCFGSQCYGYYINTGYFKEKNNDTYENEIGYDFYITNNATFYYGYIGG
ncbi:MAG: hypothetical protein LBM99_02455 [Bacillales bacterium]|jgi:hypothetical protein|nr:hypothetical protein [Bacillales bacterium]